MKTTKEKLEAARDRAENKAVEYYCEFEDELKWIYFTTKPISRYRNRKLPVLYDLWQENRRAWNDDELAFVAELGSGGYLLYEEDEDEPSRLQECTRRAIARLRTLAKRIAYWNAKYCELDFAVDECDC